MVVARTAGQKTGESRSSATSRINEIHSRSTRSDREIEVLVPKLASRSYHLEEGNSWCEDWLQYQKNTHPLFSICCHHPLHPIGRFQRVIILVGSIAFGLAITNIVYLGFLKSEQAGTAVNYVYEQTGKLSDAISQRTSIQVEQSLFFLWTVGSGLHSAFDLLIWYLAACSCFRPGGALFSATSVVVLRLNADANVEGQTDDIIERTGLESSRFSFLLAYSFELIFALFVFYFLTSTVFFSGILGCGRIPILGGRPYELRKEAAEKRRSETSDSMDDAVV
eukprot:scaffold6987_cov128-Skeletonema_dohrnii-CCMP3373.AAC.5